MGERMGEWVYVVVMDDGEYYTFDLGVAKSASRGGGEVMRFKSLAEATQRFPRLQSLARSN